MVLSLIDKQAQEYVKLNKKSICERFASLKTYPPVITPSSYFMAGSPGAGKTEFSKGFIKQLQDKEPSRKIVRIDADEIRDVLPGYNHKNAWELQPAASLGVEKILDYVFHNNQDFLLDGTFSNYNIAKRNIQRCLKHKRKIWLIYLYQDPIVAWRFTKIREVGEGRNIPKCAFVDEFFKSKDCVNKIKAEFGHEIELWLIKKDFNQGIQDTEFNIENIDSYLKVKYTIEELLTTLK